MCELVGGEMPDRVWILDHAWPGTVGGVIADFGRGGTLLQTRRRLLARRHAIELSWPDSHGFVAGTIPASEAADHDDADRGREGQEDTPFGADRGAVLAVRSAEDHQHAVAIALDPAWLARLGWLRARRRRVLLTLGVVSIMSAQAPRGGAGRG